MCPFWPSPQDCSAVPRSQGGHLVWGVCTLFEPSEYLNKNILHQLSFICHWVLILCCWWESSLWLNPLLVYHNLQDSLPYHLLMWVWFGRDRSYLVCNPPLFSHTSCPSTCWWGRIFYWWRTLCWSLQPGMACPVTVILFIWHMVFGIRGGIYGPL